MSRRVVDDGMTHVYTGQRTLWGLGTGTRCRITGTRAGGYRITTADGRRFVVGRTTLRKVP